MDNSERINQAREVLNPKLLNPDPLSALRDQLVNQRQQHRGGKQQREFLSAVESNIFLEYLDSQKVGTKFDSLGIPLLDVKLQESEFVKPPVTTAQLIWNAFRSLSPQEASNVGVWNAITLHNIQEGRLEASYLAASSEKISGRHRMQIALKNRKRQQIDDCVRTVFRTMGGLRRIRGTVSVISDCTLSRHWWMGKVLEEICSDWPVNEDRAWEELSRHWNMIAEWAVRRLTIIASPVLMAGLVSLLLNRSISTRKEMEMVLRRVGMTFSEVSLHSWSLEEVQASLLKGVQS